MLSNRARFTVPIAIVLVLLAGPALTGCSIQGIVNSATGGKVDLPGKGIPGDFPKTVPLAHGEVLLGGAIGDGKSGKVWNVTIKDAAATAFDTIVKQLQDAGFTAEGSVGTSSASGGTGAFSNADYGVLLVVAKADDKWSANYTVTTKAKK